MEIYISLNLRKQTQFQIEHMQVIFFHLFPFCHTSDVEVDLLHLDVIIIVVIIILPIWVVHNLELLIFWLYVGNVDNPGDI